MAAADVDIGYIASHLGLDQPVLESLCTAPTGDLVAAVLQAVAAKAHDFDNLYADKLQTDIELENAVRSSETRSLASKSTADSALKDVEEARKKLKEEETKRQAIENELQILKAKHSDHDADVKALNDKIETLQSSNRTNMSIIESNNKRDQTLTEELTKQHQRNVELAREVTSLQQSEQNAKGQLSSAKYREESLQQQLELARRNSDWLENELKTKSEEALKYRKEKGSRIAELQRQNEDAISQIDALKRSEQQLRDRLATAQSKAEESMVKFQKQEESFSATLESYKHELEDQRRLVDMSSQLSRQHQERVQQLDAEKERLKDNYENELRRVRVELEQERQAVSDLEERNRQLQSELDEAHIRMENAPPPGSAPQTPRQNGSAMGRPQSPFATPASIRSKGAFTATQAIEQLYQVKTQLANERRRNQQLSEELDNMMGALEAKAPEVQELHAESETLRNEIARMSELSQQSFDERDVAKKAARKAESQLATAQSETQILRTQLRDLGTQIQMLVFNAYATEKGLDQLSEEEKFRLDQLEKGEVTEEALNDMSDTHQFITQKLVVFKDIKSLQEKNEDLLRITRELAEQIESEEALAAKHQAKEDHDKVENLQLQLVHLTEEAKSMRNTMESYKMERDMFRRLLQQRTAGGDEASMMRSSLDGRAPLVSIESTEQTETLSEALRKLQSEYDSFRDAQDGVRQDLRNQIDMLSSEKSSLQTDKIRFQGEARLESERREMLQSNYTALQTENRELQNRLQNLSETAAKQDIRTQQVAEELIDAKGLLDSMRNEAANLKAEKKLWKDIQDRMGRDNENLIEEKNRLGHLLATQQSLENERNISESEARRKAQTKLEHLENDLNDVQRKLSQATEETKNIQQRKEYEMREAQKRIDELMTSLGQIREEHVSVKTTKDHLQARVSELTVELRNAEERVGRLQPRPTPRPGASDISQYQQELETQNQEMQSDVSDLKRDLELAKTQLENAKTQAEQYKELSQANEETLEDLRAAQEQYRQEMESLLDEKDAKIKELGQRVEDMSSELSRSNTELSALRDNQGDIARKFEDEKAILEEEVARLKEDSARHMEATRFHQQDLRAQAEIATRAQQDYEQELVKHAEAAKLVQQLRNDYNQLKNESASLRVEAESAKVALAQSESSWEDRRQQLEQEMAEIKARREDVNAQNKLLHQQLEGLTTQVTALQQHRQGEGGDNDTVTLGANGDAIDGMRELNSYLRREKEILEVQYDLKSQETKRLQQQTDYLQSQLDDARLKLDQERSQASQSGRSSMTHQSLLEKLNELNLYRESSMALRSENNQLKDQISERNNKIQELESKVQPLEAEIDSLKTQKSFLEDEIKQIQEDRDRWQKRTEGILTKYGRVDPAEMEQLKKSISDLQTECEALKAGEQPLKEKVTELETTLETERATWQTSRGKLVEQFKERSKRLSGERAEALQRANTLQEQLDNANAVLEEAKKQTEESGQERADLERQAQEFQQQVEQLRRQTQEAPSTDVNVVTQSADAAVSADVVTQLELQLSNVRQELDSVNAQKAEAEQQLQALQSQVETVTAERDEAIRKLAASSINGEEALAPETVASGEPQGTDSILSEAEKKALEERIAAAEAKAAEFEQKAVEMEAKITETIKERSDRMRDQLNMKLKERRTKLEEDFKQKEEDLDLRIKQEKLIWQAENASAQNPVQAAQQQQQQQQPQNESAPQVPANPAKTEASTAVPGTPSTSNATDLSQLDDAGIRQFLSTNTTVKSIIASNLKKRMEAESARLKSEYEGKIVSAKEMESKKSQLRISMFENKLKMATAKIGVVETAVSETPQKPVVEVWEVAKTATPAAAPASAPAGAPSTPRPPPLNKNMMGGQGASMARAPGTPPTPATPATPATSAALNPADAAKQPVSGIAPPKANNPFAVTDESKVVAAPNPFAPKTEATPSTAATPAADVAVQPSTEQQQQQQNTAPRSGIPMPRGGGRGRGGAYVPPSQRAASGNHPAGTAPTTRGGRGGARGGGRGGLNVGANEFQPGTKRPRGDSEAAGGAKRARGAH